MKKHELKNVTRPLAANELKGVTLYRVRSRFRVPSREAIEGELITLPADVAGQHLEHLEVIDVHAKQVSQFEYVEVEAGE